MDSTFVSYYNGIFAVIYYVRNCCGEIKIFTLEYFRLINVGFYQIFVLRGRISIVKDNLNLNITPSSAGALNGSYSVTDAEATYTAQYAYVSVSNVMFVFLPSPGVSVHIK